MKKEIIENLKKGIKYGNHNTDFIFTSEGEMLVCEYTLDCKYTKYCDINKFANRILKFIKFGY